MQLSRKEIVMEKDSLEEDGLEKKDPKKAREMAIGIIKGGWQRLQQRKEEQRKKRRKWREELELNRAKLVKLIEEGGHEEERTRLAEKIEELENKFQRRGPRLYRGSA